MKLFKNFAAPADAGRDLTPFVCSRRIVARTLLFLGKA
jgi:hypothetical protein